MFVENWELHITSSRISQNNNIQAIRYPLEQSNPDKDKHLASLVVLLIFAEDAHWCVSITTDNRIDQLQGCEDKNNNDNDQIARM